VRGPEGASPRLQQNGIAVWRHRFSLANRASQAFIALTVVISLPTLTTPGILASIMLILLGYRRRNRVLLVLAYAFMAGFIFYYYYNLQVTLLVKSFILMITGVLFLGGGLIFRRTIPEVQEQTT
jgi:uncharacterized membrane protein